MITSHLLDTFHDFDFTPYRLPIITVYRGPLDFPDQYAARLFDLQSPTPFVVVKASLEEIQDAIPARFFRMNRQAPDDPVIVEVWI